MAGDRRFTPIYEDIVEERAIYDDDRTLATWLRLRIGADRAYPNAAMVPRSAPDDVLTTLEGLGKIQLLGGDLYRCRGVDMDRTRKSDAGRRAAEARWGIHAPALPTQSTRKAPAMPNGSARNAETMPTDTDTDTETLTNVLSESPIAREPRRRATPVRGFTGPLER